MATVNSTHRAHNFIDLTGQTFGRWAVLEFHSNAKGRGTRWLCRCECGTERPIYANNLKRGRSRGCRSCSKTTHGKSGTKAYDVWIGIKARCSNPSALDYNRYGGRGIRVCERWESFESFLEDMGERPFPAATVERINNDGPYSPENCRWATRKDQGQNKHNNVILTHDKKTLCMSAWADEMGLSQKTLHDRLKSGWPVGRALTTPVRALKHMLTFGGRTLCLTEWAKETGVSCNTLKGRLETGWSVERALTTPVRAYKPTVIPQTK